MRSQAINLPQGRPVIDYVTAARRLLHVGAASGNPIAKRWHFARTFDSRTAARISRGRKTPISPNGFTRLNTLSVGAVSEWKLEQFPRKFYAKRLTPAHFLALILGIAVHIASEGYGPAQPRPHSCTRSASRRVLQQTASPLPPPFRRETYCSHVLWLCRLRGKLCAAKIAPSARAPPSAVIDMTNGASEHRPSTRTRAFVHVALSLANRFDEHLGF